MPMLDAFIPEGALAPEAEANLLREITELLVRHEGVDPSNEKAHAVSLVFLHRPIVYVAGAPATSRRYRFIPSLMEGFYDDERGSAVVRDMTEAVARAEGTTFEDVAPRAWMFPNEIPDGRWGGRGVIMRIGDFLAYAFGEKASADGVRRFAERRRKEAAAILEVARGSAATKAS